MDFNQIDVVVDSNPTLRSYTSSARHRQNSQSFLQDSYSASLDFPAYIPWHSLSTDLSDRLRQGSVKINRSNCIEWTTIREENERTPLIDRAKKKKSHQSSDSSGADSRSSNSSGPKSWLKSKHGVTEAVRGGISWQVTAFLLVNAALGAGLLNYPMAYDRIGGVMIATFLQLILIVILGLTMMILVYSSDFNCDNTYHDVLLSMCGKTAQQFSAISILLTCYGICVTFLIVIGDQFERILESHMSGIMCNWYFDRRFTITATAVLTILPMCFFKRLDFLRYAGTLGVFAMLYVVFLTVYEYFALEIVPGEIKTSPSSAINMIAVIPVMCFAYQCHEIVVPVYACMEQRNLKNFTKATVLALTLLWLLHCASGTFGYLTFGSKVLPDIMQLYNAEDKLILGGIISLVVKMITTYPPMLFCGRGALDGLYAEYFKISAESFISGEKRRRYVITTGWFVSSVIFAIFTPNIGIVIEILGSLASANVFIFPSLCLIAISKRDEKLSPRIRIFYLCVAVFLIVLGLVIFFIVLYQVQLDLNVSTDYVNVIGRCK